MPAARLVGYRHLPRDQSQPALPSLPETLLPFKTACPDAYSFPGDDPTSTYTCAASAAAGVGYIVTFLPVGSRVAWLRPRRDNRRSPRACCSNQRMNKDK